MDKNFHYYVTYTSAIEAGFTQPEASTIARAAQYVDEDEGNTVQSNSKLLMKNMKDVLDINHSEIKEIARIWPIFHFLPGDFDRIMPAVNPELIHSTNQLVAKGLMLICGTESALVRCMVDAARNYYGTANQDERLIRIGIIMHVLADTFAHQGFVGLPVKSINEVGRVTAENQEGRMTRCSWVPGIEMSGKEVYSPAFSETSFGYLGHGRIGHLPDRPGALFGYTPAWRGAEQVDHFLYRANPVEFYCAFVQMTEAMQFIRGDIGTFSNAVDKDIIFDESQGLSPYVREILNLFVTANEDSALKEHWFGYFSNAGIPQDYVTPTPTNDMAFLDVFRAEANLHRNIIISNCLPLKVFLGA